MIALANMSTDLPAVVQRIEDMHSCRTRTIEAFNDAGYPQVMTLRTCRECNDDWPCRTIRAILGEAV